jgi:PAS domain S-box-containing protein
VVLGDAVYDLACTPILGADGSAQGLLANFLPGTAALQRRVQAAEEQFDRLFNGNMTGLLFSDYDGRILDANQAFLDIVGYSRSDLQDGRLSWRTMTPPEWQAANARALAQMRKHGYATPFEKEFFRRDGSRAHVLVGSARIETQERNITFVMDITARKRIEDAIDYTARIAAQLSKSLDYKETLNSVARLLVPGLADWCAVDLIEPDGRLQRMAIAHVEPEKAEFAWALSRRYPLPPEAATGAPKVVHTGVPDLLPEITDELLRAVAVDEEHLDLLRQVGMRSGMVVPLRARGQIFGAVTLVSAQPGRHYDEFDLGLAQEIGRRCGQAVDNARLYAEAGEAIRLREEFLSIASHELKTPLTPLKLQLQLLQRRAAKLADDEASALFLKRLDSAMSAAERLDRLVDALLDASRIVSGRLQIELEEFDLAELLHELVDGFNGNGEKGQRVWLQTQAEIVGRSDRLRLAQVFGNLLSNALKYGGHKPVTVRARVEGGAALVSVQDRGIGIAEADWNRIFGRFERATGAGQYGGLGLGLYVTRQIVEALGGAVSVRSTVGEGSTFSVRLPLNRENDASEA